MNLKFRKHLAIAAAALVGVVLTCALTWVLYPRPVFHPEDLLPADDTLILLQNINRTLVVILEKRVPVLATLPAYKNGASAALVSLPGGKRAWILFEPPAQPGIDRPTIRATDPAAMTLLAGQTPRLQSDPSFAPLAETTNDVPSWIFLRFRDLPGVETQGMLHIPDEPVLIGLTKNGLQIAVHGNDARTGTLRSGVVVAEPRPFLIVQAADLRTFITGAGSALDSTLRPVLQGLLEQAVHDLFGSDVSARYDLLPLTQHESAVQIAQSDSGWLVAFSGSTDDADTLEDATDRLHAARRSMLQSVKRIDRRLDDQFSILSVSADETVIREEEGRDGLWRIRSTSRGNAGLFSAERGNQFVLSNDQRMLQSIIRRNTPGLPPDLSKASASGFMDIAATNAILKDYLPDAAGEGIPLAGSGGIVQWNLRSRGDVKILTIR